MLYFAVNGTDAELACRRLLDDEDGEAIHGLHCGSPMVGVSVDDGAPLCIVHVDSKDDNGIRLHTSTLRAIRAEKKRADEAKLRGHRR